MQTACLICNDFSISPPFTLIILRPVLNRNYKQTIEFNCRYRSHHSWYFLYFLCLELSQLTIALTTKCK
ncbi:hypothetical protein RIR_jg26888.t1 [Rhizophagus irregularis DAOM 181602=DAOM 197198]|nr:hypothetical protein RIR_jg26888.t1 [Rhizophagus irregularis DAOM 181602=DAOM 197198]